MCGSSVTLFMARSGATTTSAVNRGEFQLVEGFMVQDSDLQCCKEKEKRRRELLTLLRPLQPRGEALVVQETQATTDQAQPLTNITSNTTEKLDPNPILEIKPEGESPKNTFLFSRKSSALRRHHFSSFRDAVFPFSSQQILFGFSGSRKIYCCHYYVTDFSYVKVMGLASKKVFLPHVLWAPTST